MPSEDLLSSPGNQFNPQNYANQVLASGKSSDLSTAIAKLSFHLEFLNKHIKEQTTGQFDTLLHQVKLLSNSEKDLNKITDDHKILDNSIKRIKNQITDPYASLEKYIAELNYVHRLSLTLSRLSKFLTIYGKLQAMHASGNEWENCSLILLQLEKLLQYDELKTISFLKEYSDQIQTSKREILDRCKNYLEKDSGNMMQTITALRTLKNIMDPSLLESDVLKRCLMPIVYKFKNMFSVADQSQLVVFFDDWLKEIDLQNQKMTLISSILSSPPSSSTSNSHNTNLNSHTEEDVQDPSYLLDRFWITLCSKIEMELSFQKKAPSFTIVIRIYPLIVEKLEISAKLFPSIYAEKLYHSFRILEMSFLQGFRARLNEKLETAFPSDRLFTIMLPGAEETEHFAEVMTSQVKQVEKEAKLLTPTLRETTKALLSYIIKADNKLSLEASAFQVLPPSGSSQTPSSAMLQNINVVNSSWILHESIWRWLQHLPKDVGVEGVYDSLQECQKVIIKVVEPMFSLMLREICSSISRMHAEFIKIKTSKTTETNASQYVMEISGKLRWMQREILARFICGEDKRNWIKQLTQAILSSFLRHASLMRFSTDAMKLKLASDMTQIEFALNQVLNIVGLKLDSAVSTEYQALKAFKPFLFLESSDIETYPQRSLIPSILVIHHLITRSNPVIPLPHHLLNCKEQQYLDWLDQVDADQVQELFEKCIEKHISDINSKGEKVYSDVIPILQLLLIEPITF